MISRINALLFRWAIVLVILVAAYSYLVEPRMLRTEEVTVHIDSLPAELEGFTIGVIADLHLGSSPESAVRRAVQVLAAKDLDVVAVVGDFAGETVTIDDINRVLEPLEHAYGVPGNWDRWVEDPHDRDRVDVDLLINRGVLVAPGLWLCGIDDALLGYPSIDQAVAGAPAGVVRILLAHEPDVADWVEPSHKIALQISGHTHGGQVKLPFWGAVLLPPMGEEYPEGLQSTPTHWLYTSRGVGMSHIPVRFLCPPEITLIKLSGAN